jgi:parallel beta-helix repeat protein
VKKTAFSLILMLMFSVVNASACVSLVWANGIPLPPTSSTYIRSDGTVDPLNAHIRRDGNLYTFTQDILNSTLEIQRDNVMLDGAGFTIQGNGGLDGIAILSKNNVTVRNVNIEYFGTGVSMVQSSNNHIVGNNITCHSGVYIGYSTNNYVAENTINGQGAYGIRVFDSYANTVAGNIIISFAVGAQFEGSDDNIIVENHFSGCDPAFFLHTSGDNTISQNIMANGGGGVLVSHGCPNNKVFENLITGSSGNGIGLEFSSQNNVFFKNNITKNSCGVAIDAHERSLVKLGSPANNVFYLNNFIDNTQSVSVSATVKKNVWDNGTKGNYWSDYNGTDRGHDGIGDSAYVINDYNKDYRPLMTPVSVQLPTHSETSENASPVVVIIFPENKTYDENNVLLCFYVKEPASSMGYSLDGQNNVTIIGNVTLTKLPEGLHNITVYATGTSGNTGISETIAFIIAGPEPELFPSIPIAVASGASAIAAVACILIYFKKSKKNTSQVAFVIVFQGISS